MVSLFNIFTVFLKIGLMTIGGGYVMVPIVQSELTEKHKWFSDEEMLDIIAIASSLPGAIAMNLATIIGYRKRKTPGALVATIGALIPSIVIIILIAMVFTNVISNEWVQAFFNGVRPGIVGMMVFMIIRNAKSAKITKEYNWVIALVSLILLVVAGIHPIFCIVGAAVYGLLLREKVAAKWHEKHDQEKEEKHE